MLLTCYLYMHHRAELVLSMVTSIPYPGRVLTKKFQQRLIRQKHEADKNALVLLQRFLSLNLTSGPFF